MVVKIHEFLIFFSSFLTLRLFVFSLLIFFCTAPCGLAWSPINVYLSVQIYIDVKVCICFILSVYKCVYENFRVFIWRARTSTQVFCLYANYFVEIRTGVALGAAHANTIIWVLI